MFCGIYFKTGKQIKDKDIIGRWRSLLSARPKMDKLQMNCVRHWKPFMQHVLTGFCNATVYGSYIEFFHRCKAGGEDAVMFIK